MVLLNKEVAQGKKRATNKRKPVAGNGCLRK
jgi:hypothetical protein